MPDTSNANVASPKVGDFWLTDTQQVVAIVHRRPDDNGLHVVGVIGMPFDHAIFVLDGIPEYAPNSSGKWVSVSGHNRFGSLKTKCAAPAANGGFEDVLHMPVFPGVYRAENGPNIFWGAHDGQRISHLIREIDAAEWRSDPSATARYVVTQGNGTTTLNIEFTFNGVAERLRTGFRDFPAHLWAMDVTCDQLKAVPVGTELLSVFGKESQATLVFTARGVKVGYTSRPIAGNADLSKLYTIDELNAVCAIHSLSIIKAVAGQEAKAGDVFSTAGNSHEVIIDYVSKDKKELFGHIRGNAAVYRYGRGGASNLLAGSYISQGHGASFNLKARIRAATEAERIPQCRLPKAGDSLRFDGIAVISKVMGVETVTGTTGATKEYTRLACDTAHADDERHTNTGSHIDIWHEDGRWGVKEGHMFEAFGEPFANHIPAFADGQWWVGRQSRYVYYVHEGRLWAMDVMSRFLTGNIWGNHALSRLQVNAKTNAATIVRVPDAGDDAWLITCMKTPVFRCADVEHICIEEADEDREFTFWTIPEHPSIKIPVYVDEMENGNPIAVAWANHFRCAGCQGRTPRNSGCNTNEGRMCSACYSSRYRRCASCDNVGLVADAGWSPQDDCPSCVRGGRINYVRRYSYRPIPKFMGTGTLFHGSEVELEFPEGRSLGTVAKKVLDETGGLVYSKSDGSIHHGIEFVTRPFSYDWMMENINVFEKWFDMIQEYEGHTAANCGMHNHTSKLGYAVDPGSLTVVPGKKMRPISVGLLRVQRFCYGNPNLIIALAGRKSDQYASLAYRKSERREPVRHSGQGTTDREMIHLATHTDESKPHRYAALNFTEKTVEFRVFATVSTLRDYRFNIESCESIISYARSRPLSLERPLVTPYFKYLRENKARYPMMNEMLEARLDNSKSPSASLAKAWKEMIAAETVSPGMAAMSTLTVKPKRRAAKASSPPPSRWEDTDEPAF